jgi:acyl dehydratase
MTRTEPAQAQEPWVVAGREGQLSLSGQDLGRTRWLVIGQVMVDAFADVTGDHEWIHVDQLRAAAGPFGGTIAHRFLTLSLLPTLMQDLLSVTGVRVRVNYGLNRVRFSAPLPVGSTVRGHLVIDEAAEVEDSVQFPPP